MSIRRRMMLAALVGGWLAQVGTGAEPPRLGLASNTPLSAVSDSTNQKLAETIASHLRQSGQLRGYAVDIVVVGGSVELTGNVSSQPQREEVLRLVQGVPGVQRVVDRMTTPDTLTRVQATEPQPGLPTGPNLPGALPSPLVDTPPSNPAPTPAPGVGSLPMVQPGTGTAPTPLPPMLGGNYPPPGGGVPPGMIPGAVPPGMLPAPVPGPGLGRPEPMPMWQAPGLGYQSMNPPRMPPYAWPTYAPYNNYSRVAYPEAYPMNAWPFIGPIHPFPKVPLGWRSVKLEWDDGYWWFSRTATKHDWWRLRFY